MKRDSSDDEEDRLNLIEENDVGYDLFNLDHHVRTQSILLMEKNCKLHT